MILFDEATQKASQDGTPPPTNLDVWHETAGVKKERIYSLGLEFTVIDGRPYCRGSGSQLKEHEEKLEKMGKDIKTLFARLESIEKQLQSHQNTDRIYR